MKFLMPLLLLFTNISWAGVDLVKVDKSEHKMYLYDGDELVREYHVVFGGEPKGHKQQEGDQKTPEGTYTLDYKNESSSFYRSMHIRV
ncbi:L,D-transpeptidase family protein [Shewanella corallii]|uniref:L,D-transpeptidase family protein n=1 Tax=Shewanella corallii TaxID=560080 RepID=A0ABT0NBC4_9GAMM|nr:L,D-transpeptidase family protein [Shewanella corallii]MCL2915761.1 L,D-transpeptidase family protein [Shewanella corallii]